MLRRVLHFHSGAMSEVPAAVGGLSIVKLSGAVQLLENGLLSLGMCKVESYNHVSVVLILIWRNSASWSILLFLFLYFVKEECG